MRGCNTMHGDTGLLARIVEHTPIIIIVTNNDGKFRYVNGCGEKLLGTRRTDLVDRSFEDFLSQIEGCLGWSQIMETIQSGDYCQTKMILTSLDGAEHICRLNAFCILDEGEPAAITFMLIDITDEAEKADQIEKKNIEMARINSELIRSNAELKKLSKMKSSFLSIASHELKTPLTSIKGYSDIIMDTMKDRLDSGVLRMVENINRAAERLHRVVNDILDVNRIEQKRLRLQVESMNLETIARDCIDELDSISADRNINVDFSIQEDTPRFWGDKIRMHQVFANLLNNAVKFSPDNTTIELSIAPHNQEEIHVAVKDQGIGIDKTDQKKIFDPFYEIANTNRHSTHSSKFMGGGTGLGLSIVKGIVEAHGGRIWVESAGAKDNAFNGSEFHVVVPVKANVAVEDDETDEIDISANEEFPEIAEDISPEQKPVVLFIDSDREAVEVARMVLENVFDVLVADNGELGLSMAFSHHPSLIMLDSNLPGMNGYRICNILRTQEETRNTPIAFFSAAAKDEDIQKCFASGADDFIVKPFSGKELVDKIWRILMKKKEDATFR
ncbi:MAG: response regulator [Chitinivibrionales bacterium]|nr:response regulator [Chitinivibrionales bacterium]